MADYTLGPLMTDNVTCVLRQSDGAAIPLSQDNRDCRQFLEDWKAGATVVNDDGSPAPYSDAACRELGLDPTELGS